MVTCRISSSNTLTNDTMKRKVPVSTVHGGLDKYPFPLPVVAEAFCQAPLADLQRRGE